MSAEKKLKKVSLLVEVLRHTNIYYYTDTVTITHCVSWEKMALLKKLINILLKYLSTLKLTITLTLLFCLGYNTFLLITHRKW